MIEPPRKVSCRVRDLHGLLATRLGVLPFIIMRTAIGVLFIALPAACGMQVALQTAVRPRLRLAPAPHLQQPPSRPAYQSAVLRWRGGGTPTMLMPALQSAVLVSSLKAVTELLTCCGLGVLATRVGLLDAATTPPGVSTNGGEGKGESPQGRAPQGDKIAVDRPANL